MKPLRKKKKIKQAKPQQKKQVRPVELPAHIIAHCKATMGRQEEQAASKVVHLGYVGSGSEIAKFEYEFCRYLGLPEGHAVALSSGTAARYLALWALSAEGKEVIIPAYSAGLRNAVALAKAKAIFIDSSADGPNLDLALAAKSSASIALIPHMFGLPIDMAKLVELRAGRDLKIIEDCSQALGGTVGSQKNQKLGLVGDITVYSFSTDKVISTGGQGGMLVSKHSELIEKVRNYRDQQDTSSPCHNFNITDMQAAIGRVQLEKLDKLMARREDIFDAYKEAGFNIFDIEGETPVRQGAILQSDRASAVIDYLKQACIEAIVPVDKIDAEVANTVPHAFKLSQSTLSLPIYPHLSNDEVREIIEQVHDALES
ncbi:DegT/DnrJ/EryC1/StrS family aminotransferase [soil metagenome]